MSDWKVLEHINTANECIKHENFDLALTNLNSALKLIYAQEQPVSSLLAQIILSISEAYHFKYLKQKDDVFLKLSKEHFSKIFKLIPIDTKFNAKLINQALKLNMLDEVISKYEFYRGTQEYKNFIKEAKAISSIFVDISDRKHKPKKSFFVKVIFDYIFPLLGILVFLVGLFDRTGKLKNFFPLGLLVISLFLIIKLFPLIIKKR